MPRFNRNDDYDQDSDDEDRDNEDVGQEHMSAEGGGYDDASDDFDYDQYIADEFPDHSRQGSPSNKGWIWITAWVLIIAMLLPLILSFLSAR